MGRLEDHFGAMDRGANGSDRFFGDEFYADSRREMKDRVDGMNGVGGQSLIFDGAAENREPGIGPQVRNVRFAAGGEIVEDGYGMAGFEEPLGQVRADESGAARKEVMRHGGIIGIFG